MLHLTLTASNDFQQGGRHAWSSLHPPTWCSLEPCWPYQLEGRGWSSGHRFM